MKTIYHCSTSKPIEITQEQLRGLSRKSLVTFTGLRWEYESTKAIRKFLKENPVPKKEKFLLAVAFGDEATYWANKNPEKFAKLKCPRCFKDSGYAEVLEFDSAEERKGYVRGLKDMNGWENYSCDTPNHLLGEGIVEDIEVEIHS